MSPRILPLAALAALVGGCAESSAVESFGLLELRFGPRGLTCPDLGLVGKIEVRLFLGDGITVLDGFPIEVPCETTASLVEAPPGSYEVEVAVVGPVVGAEDVVLYRGRAELVSPSLEPVVVVMSPEVGFLTLGWRFGERALEPCEGEVTEVAIYLSGGTVGSGWSRRLRCHETPAALPHPLVPRTYTLQVLALYEGAPVYEATRSLAIEPGEVMADVELRPTGGRLSFDWHFSIAGGMETACDGPRVEVERVSARVTTADGDEPVEESFDCAEARPHVVRGARFAPGRELTLTVLAEGRHRFLASRAITMPARDLDLGLLTLEAVGAAELRWVRTASSSCAGTFDRLSVSLTRDGSDRPAAVRSLFPNQAELPLVDLPYGAYSVELAALAGDQILCTTNGRREITGRENTWPPLSL